MSYGMKRYKDESSFSVIRKLKIKKEKTNNFEKKDKQKKKIKRGKIYLIEMDSYYEL